MTFKFEVIQTIHKYFEVETESKENALEKADEMLCNGAIRFDDEPYLKVEYNLKPIA